VAGVEGAAGAVGPRQRVRQGAEVACAGVGDALASAAPELALAVLTADCASIALGSAEGVFAAVHAGWRGLLAGVVGRTVGAMRAMGATEVVGALGPCIHAECYQFSEGDLASVVAVCGERARGRTSSGRPALDLPAAVASSLAASGARQISGRDACTACQPSYFSHRARGDQGRQALVVWSREATPR
jgi:YfiH family protein